MGGRALAVQKPQDFNLREVAARTTLREIRLGGHVYVELRQVGKRTIFFCILCQTPCFNDSVLSDHLKGNLHARRSAAAKITLLGPNPWPFSDGVFFFSNPCENHVNGSGVISSSRGNNVAGSDSNNGRNDNGKIDIVASAGKKSSISKKGQDKVSKANVKSRNLVIPGVLIKEQVANMRAQFIGYGRIGSRINETDVGCQSMNKIWCAWLGEGDSDECSELLLLPKCDFAIVSFSYTYDLGRKGILDDLDTPSSPGSFFEIDDLGHRRKKRKKSFSDPEDSSESWTDHNGSPSEVCRDLSRCSPDASNQVHTSRHISSRASRRELRRQKRLTAERTCDICGQPMLLGKDVATLLNCKTRKLACSSRNTNGAFHLFHTSCLIHWILLCEFETWTNQATNLKPKTRGRKAKQVQKSNCISIFCPECQGTGIHIEGDELEKPSVPLSEMFLHKLKAIEAHKAWMKNPEVLKNCSTGLHFSSDSSEKLHVQEKVMPMKMLHFYQTDK